jgi:hypothetical protein
MEYFNPHFKIESVISGARTQSDSGGGVGVELLISK